MAGTLSSEAWLAGAPAGAADKTKRQPQCSTRLPFSVCANERLSSVVAAAKQAATGRLESGHRISSIPEPRSPRICCDFSIDGFQSLLKLLDDFRMTGSQVVLLANVPAEVEQ